MTERVSKIDEGTIGSKPCEIALNKILIRIDNAKITSIIMRRHQDLRDRLNKLKILPNRGFARHMMKLVYDEIKGSFELHEDNMPVDAFTYSLCCYTALYREALKETKSRVA